MITSFLLHTSIHIMKLHFATGLQRYARTVAPLLQAQTKQNLLIRWAADFESDQGRFKVVSVNPAKMAESADRDGFRTK